MMFEMDKATDTRGREASSAEMSFILSLGTELGTPGDTLSDELWARATGSEVLPCSWCGRRTVVHVWRGARVHIGADGTLNRGCRAASFTSDKGWDETIPKHRNAKVAS
jgi:hypothetical protein